MTHDEPTEDDIVFEEEVAETAAKKKSSKLAQLREELKAAKAERQEYLTGWQKARAELINAKQRMEKDFGERVAFANERLIVDLLPTLDSFDMAMANTEAWEAVDTNWRTGVEYIHSQLTKTLADYGVEAIREANVAFDPTIHEPMETQESNDAAQNDTIARVIQAGYRIKDRIIRPAKVVVYKTQS